MSVPVKTPSIDARFKISSNEAIRAKYRSLLASDWNRSTFQKTLSLLWDEVRNAVKSSSASWSHVLKPARIAIGGKEVDRAIVDRIRDFRTYVRGDALPDVPAEFSAPKSARIAQAEKAWTYLVLQSLARIEDDAGILADTQSILYQTAIAFFLPELKECGLPQEHDCLVNALYTHLFVAWRDSPSHFFYLQSQIQGYLDQSAAMRQSLRTAFDVTPPEDHSYLTKAQAYWTSLADKGLFGDALHFLYSLHRSAPADHAAEVEEMISEVLLMEKQGQRKSS